MTKTFLITGSSGFIGQNLVRQLLLDGHLGIDIVPPEFIEPSVFIKSDIVDYDFEDLFHSHCFDHVIISHLPAAFPSPLIIPAFNINILAFTRITVLRSLKANLRPSIATPHGGTVVGDLLV